MMITYDDDNIIFVFHNGESRSFRRPDGARNLDRNAAFGPTHAKTWLRRTDDAMFANYYEPCVER